MLQMGWYKSYKTDISLSPKTVSPVNAAKQSEYMTAGSLPVMVWSGYIMLRLIDADDGR